MAEPQQIILEINIGDSLTKSAELKNSLNQLIELRKQLVEEVKKGGAEEAKALEAVNVAIRTQQQEYRTQTKIIDGYVAQKKTETNTANLANNSIQQNRDLLKQLTAQYIQLKNPSLAATNQIKQLSDTLKKQEGVIGDTRRNVGNYFNEFAKGVPLISGIVDPLNNMKLGFDAAGGGVKGFGAALATTGLPLFIAGINMLISAFSAFEPIANAVEDIMSGLSAAFSTSYSEGVKLAQLKRQLEINDRNQIVTNAELRKSINELEAVAANKAAKDQDRIDALEKANALRVKQLENEKNDSKERQKIIDLEVKQSEEGNKKKAAALGTFYAAFGKGAQVVEANKDLLRQQEEERAKTIDIEDRFNQQTIANENKIALLKRNIEEDKEAASEKSLARLKEKADEEERIRQKNLDNDRNVAIEQGKIDEALTKKEKDEIEAIRKAREEAYKKQLELQDKGSAEYLKAVEDTAKKELAIEAQKERDKKTLINAGFAFATDIISSIAQTVQDSASQKIEQEQHANDAAHKSLERQLEAGKISKEEYNKTIEKMDGELREKEREANRKAWETNKAIQITMAIINTAQAIIAQLSNPTPYVGIALAAFAAATGAVQLGIIAAQEPPAFAGGVIGLDGPGTETSDDISARLSVGESVMTARATRKYHRELAWMEASVGNTPNYNFGSGRFAGGFISPTISDGGFAARNTAQSVDNALNVANMEALLRRLPTPKLSIVEFEDKQASKNRSVTVSEA